MPTRRRVEVLAPAEGDLKRLLGDDPKLARRARALLHLLEDGRITGQPLAEMSRYGDMRDCHKIYFGVSAHEATHRIVYQEKQDGSIEVAEVVAVEARPEGYVYLLASKRLGRLPEESEARFRDLHQRVIAERSERRRAASERPGSGRTR